MDILKERINKSFNSSTVESDIIELVEEGALSWEEVARAGLRHISDYDLVLMAAEYEWNRNVFLEDDEDDE